MGSTFNQEEEKPFFMAYIRKDSEEVKEPEVIDIRELLGLKEESPVNKNEMRKSILNSEEDEKKIVNSHKKKKGKKKKKPKKR
eukprot:CAMPEP_0170554310 /NCGR_PEP_ID=MMETSP0211-20121228/12163_1 /TAXON_ID=311385 /ORGANISM="Pseudokeronopsis sp., Strain OXSARD2" /LENGTH=82 /DNA_ID=CAMNT_0010863261 /DNA_START=53 /DNA_END=301 /DNA_ORIENTATION=-